ncbi:MAG: hypothetical protein ACI9CB_001398 [Rhodothermales bacterium]
MQDRTNLAAVITSVKTAIEIAADIRQLEASLTKNERKLKCTDLMMTLAESQIQLKRVEIFLADKESELVILKKALMNRRKVVREGEAYY